MLNRASPTGGRAGSSVIVRMELRKVISSISVEPPYLLISLSYGLFAIMVQGLYIDKETTVSSSETC